MKNRAAIASLLAAVGLFASSVIAKDEVLLALSMAAAGAGLVLFLPTVARLLSRGAEDSDLERRLNAVEQRLKVAETELESATSEVARLKEEREFDRLLSSGNRPRSTES